MERKMTTIRYGFRVTEYSINQGGEITDYFGRRGAFDIADDEILFQKFSSLDEAKKFVDAAWQGGAEFPQDDGSTFYENATADVEVWILDFAAGTVRLAETIHLKSYEPKEDESHHVEVEMDPGSPFGDVLGWRVTSLATGETE